jgi:type II secretory pathway component PulJ
MFAKQGVTLAEVLITLSLFVTFLVLSGTLIRKAGRVLRFSEGKASSIRAATHALDVIARDLRGAQNITTPNAGTAKVLEFAVVDAANNQRLYPSVAPPRFPILSLNQASNLQTIKYDLAGDELRRNTKMMSGAATITRVAVGIADIDFDRKTKHSMVIRLGVQEERDVNNVSYIVPLLEGLP